MDQAEEAYQQAEALYRQQHDNLGLANTLESRGDLFVRLRKVDQAEELYRQALLLYESIQEPYGMAITCASLSAILAVSDPYGDEGDMLAQRAKQIAEQLPPNVKAKIISLLELKNTFENQRRAQDR